MFSFMWRFWGTSAFSNKTTKDIFFTGKLPSRYQRAMWSPYMEEVAGKPFKFILANHKYCMRFLPWIDKTVPVVIVINTDNDNLLGSFFFEIDTSKDLHSQVNEACSGKQPITNWTW